MKQQKKFTISSANCRTTDTVLIKVPEMKYGIIKQKGSNLAVCNATTYIKAVTKQDEFDNASFLNDFYDKCQHFIDSMIDIYAIPLNEVFFINGNGDLLINSVLDTTLICYTHSSSASEAMDYLRDVYTNLFAVDDTLLAQLCALKVPNEIIQMIAKNRGIMQ